MPKMSDMMRQGQSSMSIFEQMYMQSLQAAAPKKEEEDTRVAAASETTMIDTSGSTVASTGT